MCDLLCAESGSDRTVPWSRCATDSYSGEGRVSDLGGLTSMQVSDAYVCMYVCMYVCTCLCLTCHYKACVYAHLCVCMHACISTTLSEYDIHISIHTYIHVYTYIHTHTHTHIEGYMMCIHVYIHTSMKSDPRDARAGSSTQTRSAWGRYCTTCSPTASNSRHKARLSSPQTPQQTTPERWS
jgi:hypothetical protein